MLRSAQSMIGYRVRANRSEIGKIDDLLFDADHWLARYWVINSTGLLASRDETFVPIGLTDWIDHSLRDISLSTSKELIEKSPDLRLRSPSARWPQPHYSERYQWPFFWTGAGTLGTATVKPPSEPIASEKKSELALYSSAEAFRYRLHATDRNAGYVEDFLLDDRTWSIRYLVVTRRRWWPTRAVAMPPHWITDVSWKEHLFNVDLTRKQIFNAPRFNRSSAISPDFEEKLTAYYAGHRYRKTA
ncbi:MAG: hypothetical protein A2X94_13960 [Bdellovibrionales bacterium GWB1_55_8]|nr:MAG: hypothetical protein A2X94_13960 [Bdellovibrionales bacterium GWB1_55_8]